MHNDFKAFPLIAAAIVLSGTTALANPIHDKLMALSERERNEKLRDVVQDEGCRVTRSFFRGLDKAANAFWNVACSNRKTFSIMIRNDSQGSTRILECDVIKAMGGPECFQKFERE